MFELEYLDINYKKKYELLAKKTIENCFEEEGLKGTKLVVNIILTNSENIKILNKKYRGIDKATDVLSFPMFSKEELKAILKNKETFHEDILGDIVISLEKVEEQAEEYGHGFEREFCYMIAHGFCHLMGYDHIDENDKKEMREKEERILKKE